MHRCLFRSRDARRALVTMAAASLAFRALACSTADDGAPGLATSADGSTLGDGGAAGDERSSVLGDGAGAVVADTAPPLPPSYCEGLTFFADFDEGLAPSVGDTSPRPFGSVGTAPGRFGNAASLTLDAGADGSGIFYDLSDGGSPFYSAAEGSIAFWFKRERPTPSGPLAYVRPIARDGGVLPGGPAVASSADDRFGVFDYFSGQPLASLALAEMEPYRHPGDFDQIVTAWRTSDDAGAGGVALVALNGGLGQILTDAGVDGAGIDGAADDAGDYQTPYAARRTVVVPRWPAPNTVRLGGVSRPRSTTPEGDIDELAIWNRILTREEIAAMYTSATSLRITCHLP